MSAFSVVECYRFLLGRFVMRGLLLVIVLYVLPFGSPVLIQGGIGLGCPRVVWWFWFWLCGIGLDGWIFVLLVGFA